MKARPSRFRSLGSLERAVVRCEACPRLIAHCRQVARERKRAYRDQEYWGRPVPGFGDPRARLVIVGLAPAAHGANRTGRMFTGDSSGDWLYAALHRYGFASRPGSNARDDGLTLRNAWITSAARCAPPANKPTADELERCRPYLARELELISRTRVVITLGRIGHEAFLRATGLHESMRPSERPPFGHGLERELPGGILLISSYHPSRQNTNTGRLTRRMWHAVFARARSRLRRA